MQNNSVKNLLILLQSFPKINLIEAANELNTTSAALSAQVTDLINNGEICGVIENDEFISSGIAAHIVSEMLKIIPKQAMTASSSSSSSGKAKSNEAAAVSKARPDIWFPFF
jgi:hypothetical protein